MKILFDQGTPAPLRRALANHSVATAFEKGWSNLSNGNLLREAEREFDLFITTDTFNISKIFPKEKLPFWFCRRQRGRTSARIKTKLFKRLRK